MAEAWSTKTRADLRKQILDFGRTKYPTILESVPEERKVLFGYTEQSAGPYAAILYAHRLFESDADIGPIYLNGTGPVKLLGEYLDIYRFTGGDVILVSPVRHPDIADKITNESTQLRARGVNKIVCVCVIDASVTPYVLSDLSTNNQKRLPVLPEEGQN